MSLIKKRISRILNKIKNKSYKMNSEFVGDLFLLFETNDLLIAVESKIGEYSHPSLSSHHIINQLSDSVLNDDIFNIIKEILLNNNELRKIFFRAIDKRLNDYENNCTEIKLLEIFLYNCIGNFYEYSIGLERRFYEIFIKILKKIENIDNNIKWIYSSDFWDNEFFKIIGKDFSKFIKESMEFALKNKDFDEFVFLLINFNIFEALEIEDLYKLFANTELLLVKFLKKEDLDSDIQSIVLEVFSQYLEDKQIYS